MAAKASSQKPTYFATPAKWRAWLKKHHAKEDELLVGFWKRETGKPSITWPESVDQALCFGWIDGVRRSLGAESYTIRFTRRRAGSNWSAVNVRKMAELEKAGLVMPAGREAFKGRTQAKTAIYAYEQERKLAALTPDLVKRFKADKKAWDYYSAQADWYRRVTAHWITSARKPVTRDRRLAQLMADSAEGTQLKQLLKYRKK